MQLANENNDVQLVDFIESEFLVGQVKHFHVIPSIAVRTVELKQKEEEIIINCKFCSD